MNSSEIYLWHDDQINEEPLENTYLVLLKTYRNLYSNYITSYRDGRGSKELEDFIDNLKMTYNERRYDLVRLSKQFDVMINDPRLTKIRKLWQILWLTEVLKSKFVFSWRARQVRGEAGVSPAPL